MSRSFPDNKGRLPVHEDYDFHDVYREIYQQIAKYEPYFLIFPDLKKLLQEALTTAINRHGVENTFRISLTKTKNGTLRELTTWLKSIVKAKPEDKSLAAKVAEVADPSVMQELLVRMDKVKRYTTIKLEQGLRQSQEDQPLVFTSGDQLYLLANDGHGGADMAKHIVRKLPQLIGGTYYPDDGISPLPAVSLAEAFSYLQVTAPEDSGATVLVARVDINNPQRVELTYLGDCNAYFIPRDLDLNKVKQLISDEELHQTIPGTRIPHPNQSSGGINVTRSLGDKNFGDRLSHRPDTKTVDLGDNNDGWLLVGSDGMSLSDVKRAVIQLNGTNPDKKLLLQSIINAALKRREISRDYDNVSGCMVDLQIAKEE